LVLPDGGGTPWAAAVTLGGNYTCTGNSPTGNAYAGTTVITPKGDTYDVRWSIGPGIQDGIGILTGSTFSVAWSSRESPSRGIAVYQVNDKGALTGQWAQAGIGINNSEILTPR